MPSFFENLGRSAGRAVRKARWLGQELMGTEDSALDAEYRVGRDMAEALAADLPPDGQPLRIPLLETCGQRLVECLTNRRRRFQFLALPGAPLNAFALPGGFVYVTEGLLKVCQANEPQVAFILGHEMAHVVRLHAKDRILGNSLLSLLITATPGSNVLKRSLHTLARQFLRNAYTQDQELEADAWGVRITRAAGYQPSAALDVLRLLQEHGGEPSEVENYFSSHPPFPLRMQRIARLLEV